MRPLARMRLPWSSQQDFSWSYVTQEQRNHLVGATLGKDVAPLAVLHTSDEVRYGDLMHTPSAPDRHDLH